MRCLVTNLKENATQATGGELLQNKQVLVDRHHKQFNSENQDLTSVECNPDLQMCKRFLTLLDEDSDVFTFQTFDDDSKRKDPKLARIFHGSLEQHFHEMCPLQARGAGVFVTINETDADGRKTKNIKKVRAVFVDLDGSPLDPVMAAPLTPQIIVQSSPGRFHAYWLVDDLPLKHFSIVQKALIQMFKADPSVHDLPRVMRLPGFFHQKADPFQTQILETSGELPFNADDFLSAFVISLEKIVQDSSQEKKSYNEEDDRIFKILNERGMVRKKDNCEGAYSIICPWVDGHTYHDHRTLYYLPGHNGYTKPGFLCFHDHCKNKTIHDLLQKLDYWPEPKPIQSVLYPVPPFDPEKLLPECLRTWIMDEADRMPCPPDFIAANALVAIGSIIGARCAIRPKTFDDWVIVPNLWGGAVGLPATKKTPAISAALTPLEFLISQEMKKHETECVSCETLKTVWDAKEKAIEDRIKAAARDPKKGDLDCIGQELFSHRQNPPQVSILRRYKSNDTTIEKLGELLRDNPAGILIVRDELIGLLASWEKVGREGDRSFFLESWNGTSSFDTDRIKRGSIFIPNLCTSIFGGIQPDKLITYLEQTVKSLSNDGMLQRFQLLVYPDHIKWEWRDRSPAKEARNRVFSVFESLARLHPVDWGASPEDKFSKFPYFHFDDDAQKIFIEWTKNLHKERIPNEDNPLIAQHLAKFDKLFPALALIFHLIDCAAKGYRGQTKSDSALRAKEWCEYLEAHARRCYGLLADDGFRAAQTLADKISRGKLTDNFTARDVRRNQWRYLTNESSVQAALEWLEDENWLRAHEVGGIGPGTGRRTIRYSINPKIRKSGSEHE